MKKINYIFSLFTSKSDHNFFLKAKTSLQQFLFYFLHLDVPIVPRKLRAVTRITPTLPTSTLILPTDDFPWDRFIFSHTKYLHFWIQTPYKELRLMLVRRLIRNCLPVISFRLELRSVNPRIDTFWQLYMELINRS